MKIKLSTCGYRLISRIHSAYLCMYFTEQLFPSIVVLLSDSNYNRYCSCMLLCCLFYITTSSLAIKDAAIANVFMDRSSRSVLQFNIVVISEDGTHFWISCFTQARHNDSPELPIQIRLIYYVLFLCPFLKISSA